MKPAQILVVDDELELERLIKQRFKKRIQNQEFSFVFASNGVEALEKLQKLKSIDIVLTDIQMPDMDGLSLIQCLPKFNSSLKAIVISAYDDRARIRQAMNRGAYDFLTKPINFEDLEQTLEKTLSVVREIQAKQREDREYQQTLFHAALHDPLTELPNRINLCNHLSYLLAHPITSLQVALLFIDLDGFKKINDTFGHLMGDALLQEFAHRLKLCLRENDFVARLGGDEFVVVLHSQSDLKLSVAIAERILESLNSPFQLNGQSFGVSASIGITLSQAQDHTPDALLHQADLAMYRAKAKGKGRYVLFDVTHEGFKGQGMGLPENSQRVEAR